MMPLLFLQTLGPGEIAAILLVALLLFGAKRVPELARSLGQGIREFKKSVSGLGEESSSPGEEKPTATK